MPSLRERIYLAWRGYVTRKWWHSADGSLAEAFWHLLMVRC